MNRKRRDLGILLPALASAREKKILPFKTFPDEHLAVKVKDELNATVNGEAGHNLFRFR